MTISPGQGQALGPGSGFINTDRRYVQVTITIIDHCYSHRAAHALVERQQQQ